MMGKPIMFLLVICLSLAMAVSTLEAAEPPPRNVAAVTLDFCETPTLAGKRFWSRQDTEQWYKTIHDTGFDTVYLRMSNGRAYWPSKVLLMYTNHGHGHHGEVLEKVVQDRDLLKEFVEVGRKYGKKLVYWLPIYDDETTTNNYVNNPEMAAKHGLFPWQSVLGRDQPGLYWEHRDAWKYPRERDKAGDIMPNDKRRWWGGLPGVSLRGRSKIPTGPLPGTGRTLRHGRCLLYPSQPFLVASVHAVERRSHLRVRL